MTMYAPMSVSAVRFEHPDSCGKEHARKKETDRLEVTCAKCEPLIKRYHVGWASHVEDVTLTDAEEAEQEAEAKRSNQLLAAAGTALGQNLAFAVSGEGAKRPRARKATV